MRSVIRCSQNDRRTRQFSSLRFAYCPTTPRQTLLAAMPGRYAASERIAAEKIDRRGALHDEGEQLLQAKVSASMLFREFEDSPAAANHASQRIVGDDHR